MEHNIRIAAFPENLDPFIIKSSEFSHDCEFNVFRRNSKKTQRFDVFWKEECKMHFSLLNTDTSIALQLIGLEDTMFYHYVAVLEVLNRYLESHVQSPFDLEIIVHNDDYKLQKFMDTYGYSSMSYDEAENLIFFRM